MNSAVTLTELQWLKIYNQIAQEYPDNVLTVQSVMKETLGFTTKTHTSWEPMDNNYTTYLKKHVLLEFHDDKKQTFFLLKYSDILNSNQ